MTDTIKKLQEVREVLQWVAGFCDGYVIAPKEGDKLVVERCDKALAILDAVIAGMQKPALTPEQRGELIEEMREAFTVENIKPYKYRGDPIEAALAIVEKRLLGEG